MCKAFREFGEVERIEGKTEAEIHTLSKMIKTVTALKKQKRYLTTPRMNF